MSSIRDITEKDADLAVLHVAGRSTILVGHASRFVARFGEAGLVDGDYGLMHAELLQDISPQFIAHPGHIPDGRGEQPLHAIGRTFSRLFGQLPAIFARRFTQEALQIGQDPTTRLWAGEMRSNAGM